MCLLPLLLVCFLHHLALVLKHLFCIKMCSVFVLNFSFCIGVSLWTKLVEVMEFQLSYFKSSKTMLWKCCTEYVSKFGKLSSGHRTAKRSVFIAIPKKGNAKECSNYHAFISQDSVIILKIFQVRLQQYVNWELPDVQARFRKGRGNRDQIVNIRWIIENAREFQKYIYFCFIE